MIIYSDETVFNVNVDCIVNTINCVGVMGKGLALEFALRFPKLNKIYKKQCVLKEITTGKVYFYEIDGNKIINFPTKFHFKYPSQIKWIEQGLKNFAENYKKYNIKSIAFPLLGCSNGELDKNLVMNLMEKYLSCLNLTIYICKSIKLNGKEKEMLKLFKEKDFNDCFKDIKLTKIQKENLNNSKAKINRFFQILEIDKIGINTYMQLFNYFYKFKENNKTCEQLDIFNFM